jgi:4-diphosphocytidyl-2-C-methyl-D-erythritol kinase
MNWIKVPSFAKINLGLYIKEKRKDGFHSIESIFQTISLKDTLYFKLSGSKIEISSDNPYLPVGPTNLIYKAANMFKEKENEKLGIKIKVKKNIPIGAGLGGGSSNAAVTLLTLNSLLKHPKNTEELTECANKLGSDVPFFLKGGTALVKGRGEKILWEKDIPTFTILLALPAFSISTKDAYDWWDKEKKQTLTKTDLSLILHDMQEGKREIFCELENSFCGLVIKKYPQVKKFMEKLRNLKPINVLLSGSGPAMFAVFGSEEYNYGWGDIKTDNYALINCRSISREKYFNLLKPKED